MRRTFAVGYAADDNQKGYLDMLWKNSSRRKILKAMEKEEVKYSYLYFLN